MAGLERCAFFTRRNFFASRFQHFSFYRQSSRSTPIGYRINRVRLQGNRTVSYDVFASGWLNDDRVMGRPVDLEILSDGSTLVSNDDAGRIYRISYKR